MEIFSIFAIVSFLLNLIQFMNSKKNRNDFNKEIEHEVKDVCELKEKIQESLEIINSINLTDKEKIERIEHISTFCKGFLDGVEHHIPEKKIFF